MNTPTPDAGEFQVDLEYLHRESRSRAVLIVGDLMLDEYLSGDVRRLSPEAPVPVVELRSRIRRPGGAANVAVHVAAWDCAALLIGIVGNDGAGNALLRALASSHVATEGVERIQDRPTTVKARVGTGTQQIIRLDRETRKDLGDAYEQRLLRAVSDRLPQVDACIISDYGKGVITERVARQCIDQARELKKPIVVDPKNRNLRFYRGSTLIKPNRFELERAVNCRLDDDRSLISAARQVHEEVPESILLVTCDSRGMLLLAPDCDPVFIDAKCRTSGFTAGAGDTVASTIAIALACGYDAVRGARLANWLAGMQLDRKDTKPVAATELSAGRRACLPIADLP